MELRTMMAVSLMAAVTGILAYLAIPLPFTPAMITGQTLGVMLAGSLLGRKAGAASMILLLLIGFVGIPVFSGGMTGPAKLFGPTGGYIWSWPAAAWSIGRFLEFWGKKRGNAGWVPHFIAHFLFGVLFVYLIGVPWLAAVQQLPLAAAAVQGALPFLPGDFFKTAAATLLAVRLKKYRQIDEIGRR